MHQTLSPALRFLNLVSCVDGIFQGISLQESPDDNYTISSKVRKLFSGQLRWQSLFLSKFQVEAKSLWWKLNHYRYIFLFRKKIGILTDIAEYQEMVNKMKI